jgi:hypothetical protein
VAPGDLRQLLEACVRSMCGTSPCTYVAGPLTSGRAFYDGSVAAGPEAALLERRNREAMAGFADALRLSLCRPVVDPGVLQVPDWDGSMHGSFFLAVLERYCDEVWFMDDWQYSRGASKEFVLAQTLGLRCVDCHGKVLSTSDGLQLVTEAVDFLERRGHDDRRHFVLRRQQLEALSPDR